MRQGVRRDIQSMPIAMKKILIIAIIVIAAAGILYLGYLFSSRQTPSVNSPASGGNIPGASFGGNVAAGGGTLPQASFSPLAIAADMPTFDYFVDAGKNITIIQPDGGIVKVTGGQTLSSSTITNLVRASFSADGKKIFAAFGDSSASQASVFDIEKASWQPLPAGAQNFAWAPSGSALAYFSAGTLSTIDIKAKNPKPKSLIRLRDEDATLEWPAPDTIFIKDKASAHWQSSLWAFSIKTATLSPMIEDRLGLDTMWSEGSPTLGIALLGNQNGEGGSLSLVDRNGKTLHNFNFLTLPSKCAFAALPSPAPEAPSSIASSPAAPVSGPQLLVCAVPRDRRPLDLNPLPDAYQKKSLFTSDDFYSINTADGTVKTLFNDTTKNFDASNLKIFGQALYFVNRYDQKLYSLPIGN